MNYSEKTKYTRYKHNIENAVKRAQKLPANSNKNRRKTSEIILENIILVDFKKIDLIQIGKQIGKYVLFESPANGVNKYNLGKIISIDEIQDKQLKIGINCKYDPDLIPTNIAEHFRIERIDQPIMGTIYMTVPKPRNYKNP